MVLKPGMYRIATTTTQNREPQLPHASRNTNPRVSKSSRVITLLVIVQLILFIVDSGCTKHMTGNLKLLCNFVEKFLGTVHFGNDQFAPILGYGDLNQGNIMIKWVYYVEGLNHNLFSVGQFCDADLEVAFRKSTCFVRDLQGNDLLTGNRGSDLYTISLQETTSSTPICFMAKASPTQAWLWHRRLSHLNFINHLLSMKDIVKVLLVEILSRINFVLVMYSTTSAVTYTSVYTDKAFWGANDEEISEGGIPRDEDEREPMFIQTHDPDYVLEPIYPEYIPLEDEHEFLAEEQPLPPVDSPTTESPGYVTESDPEEDPKEYEEDETENSPVDYPMDGGYDGDDDAGDSSGDDADDKDEDDEDEEEEDEEHLAPADFAIVLPADEPVSPPEGTEPVIPPPSTNITIGARITVRPQASISLPPEAEVERLLAMTTPSPSPPILLSPPFAGERLARCTTPPAHSSPPHVPSPLLPSSGCPTQIRTFRIASTQALIDAVTAALPSPPLLPLPSSLYIPPPVDRRDDIPESEQPPSKRLCLSTLGSRYEIGESSTARPIRDQGVDYGFVSTVEAEVRRQGISEVGYGIRDTWIDPAEAIPEVAPMTVGEVNTRVTELAELHERDT
ncbi:hypothetical protein Tco_0574408 [Tanacetum coccineum]